MIHTDTDTDYAIPIPIRIHGIGGTLVVTVDSVFRYVQICRDVIYPVQVCKAKVSRWTD